MQEIANVAQAAAWDGDEGTGWAAHRERYDTSIRAYREPMLAAAAITDGERVLDFGCGNGQSSRDAARATPSGSILGADLSAAMLEQARRQAHAEGLQNIDFVQADAQVHPFDADAYDLACQLSVVQGLLAPLDDNARSQALAVFRDAIQAHETPNGVLFNSATWFITARRPGGEVEPRATRSST